MSDTLLIDLHASLLRITSKLAEEVAIATGKPTTPLYFDSYADEDTLPAGDHVGLSGLTFDVDSHLVEGSFMIGFTTQVDANLFRLMKGVNCILSKMIPGNQLLVINGTTGNRVGFLSITDNTKVMPVSGKAARPIQMIGVNFITTLKYIPEEIEDIDPPENGVTWDNGATWDGGTLWSFN